MAKNRGNKKEMSSLIFFKSQVQRVREILWVGLKRMLEEVVSRNMQFIDNLKLLSDKV